MRVLWLINIALPEASLLMNEKPTPYGGWLVNMSRSLSQNSDIELYIAFPKKGIRSYEKYKGEDITYYSYKKLSDNDKNKIEYNMIFHDIICDSSPDIVNIYGTEYSSTLSMVNTCNKDGVEVVISTQGLVSIIHKHLYADLPLRVIYGATLRNIIHGDSIFKLKRLYYKRGEKEIEAIKKVKNIIGRTTFDRAVVRQINPNINYYTCNESLRKKFYNYKWTIDNCERHSIFLSQSNYPIKGIHYLIEALTLIVKEYPDMKLYVAGEDISKRKSLIDKLLVTKYSKYIEKLIKKKKLEDVVMFVGQLDEQQMIEQYLKSNVFVCSSSIENSPNSLAEAMLLGVPCVAAYVGGIPDMINHMEEGFLYQSNAPYMLAHYICEIFRNKELMVKFSEESRKRAMKAHDLKENTEDLINIYKEILNRKS